MNAKSMEVASGKPRRLGRRLFLIGAVAAGGGLAIGAGYIGMKLSGDRKFKLPAAQGASSFGAWLTIDTNGVVTVAVPNQEMGQGISTTIPMLVAEELDCDPGKLKAIDAPVHAVYANPTMLLDGLPFAPADHGALASSVRWTMEKLLRALGVQATGGSTSTRNAIQAAREAGAAARAMLLSVAAGRLSVPVGELQAANGQVAHQKTGRKLSFGELAQDAAAQPVMAGKLKSPDQYRLIGRGIARLDVPAKVDGSAQFGIDVRLEGQLYAAIAHCPVFGGKLRRADAPNDAPGFVRLVKGPDWVAAVAKNTWQARQALAATKIEWDEGPNATFSSAELFRAYASAIDRGEGRVFDERGDLKAGMSAAASTIKAEYRVPFLAHATMEPMNCTVHFKDGKCHIWAGNQAPTLVKWMGAGAAGLDSANVEVHTPFLGGGFGRRAEMDFVVQAVMVARESEGVPVQTIWSREEDMQHDAYRPAALSRFEAGFARDGALLAWSNDIASPSVSTQFTKRLMPSAGGGLPDKTNAEGATLLPYALPAYRVRHSLVEVPVPVGFWRSVGHSFNAFFSESFVDECAAKAGKDPYEFRRMLLKDNPRYLRVLDAAARKAGWGQPLKTQPGAKVGRGIALAESFHSIVAEVAEVSVSDKNEIRVTRVVAAVDCGLAIDPAIVNAQVGSAILYGLTAALFGRIDVEKGRVVQSNFGDYPMLTLANSPAIEVDIVNSGAELGGIGEVGTPPIAPAVANAIFAATGTRLRELPLKLG